MKILFLANAASIHTVRWVNSLSKKGHKVHLVYKRDDSPEDNEICDEVTLHSLKHSGTKAYFTSAYELNKLFKKIKPDIVNVHYASGYGTLARLAKIRPIVLSVWGSDVYDFPHQGRLKMKLIRKNLLFANQIASTSNCMAEVTRKLMYPINVNIAITPFGVDINKFSRKNCNNNYKNIVIGNIKTLSSKYGISDLIKAIKILKDDLVNENKKNISDKIKVLIYGDGDQKVDLINLTKDLNLNDTISFMGKIPNSQVPKALEKFDIFCATSVLNSESFGVAVVEAMSVGIPVVATDVDGFKEVVNDNVTGFIVQKKNPLKIANGLKKLVLDEKLREDMGLKSRKRVLELYDWSKNVDAMESLYNYCIDSRK